MTGTHGEAEALGRLWLPRSGFLVRTAHTEEGGQNPDRLKAASLTYTRNRPDVHLGSLHPKEIHDFSPKTPIIT